MNSPLPLSSSIPIPPSYALPKKLQKILKKSEQEEVTEEIGEKAVIRSIMGNTLITSLKFLTYATSGSAAMLSEAFHSLIDSINQGLLYVGLKQAKQQPDSMYQYGYGRAPYFWSLVSAMGIFWMGFSLMGYHGVSQLLNPPEVMEFGLLTPIVLAVSFLIDGSVLWGVLKDLKQNKPKHVSFYQYLKRQKDPMILTVLLEDIAACTGVIFAGLGITASYLTGNPIYDSVACLCVAGLLGVVSVLLVQTNKRFLIGRAVEPEIEHHIREILASRPSIEAIYAVQSQYVSPSKFSYKAEIDFNGAYFAEQLIKLGYDLEFQNVQKEDLTELLACFSEDVMRLVEKEIDDIEDEIRQYYPEAGYIELEPNANPRDRNSFLINQRRKMKEFLARSQALPSTSSATAATTTHADAMSTSTHNPATSNF